MTSNYAGKQYSIFLFVNEIVAAINKRSFLKLFDKLRVYPLYPADILLHSCNNEFRNTIARVAMLKNQLHFPQRRVPVITCLPCEKDIPHSHNYRIEQLHVNVPMRLHTEPDRIQSRRFTWPQ